MPQDSIEREVTIEAPVERVWSVITEAEHLGRWFGDAGAEIDLRPGGELTMRWESGDTARARVEAVEPPRRFAYRWFHYSHADDGGEHTPANSTLVEFTLTPEGAARGCASWSAASRRSPRATSGQRRRLRGQRARLAGASSASSSSTRRRWPPDRTARTRGPRRARRPDALAGPLPPRRARGGDGDDAGRRAAGQPRRRDQAPGGARPRGPGHVAPRGPRGPLHGPPGAPRRGRRRPRGDRARRGTSASRRSRRWRRPAGRGRESGAGRLLRRYATYKSTPDLMIAASPGARAGWSRDRSCSPSG